MSEGTISNDKPVGGPSNILTPTDSIIITIDNRTGQADMKLSRDLPSPYVCGILARLISRLEDEVMKRIQQGPGVVGVGAGDPNPFGKAK